MKKILLIEDDPAIRQMYTTLFQKSGFDVVSAENGKVGLEQIRQDLPDVILCDMDMPVMNGLETIKALKSDVKTRAIKIVVLTNRVDDDTTKQAIELGAESYFIKSDQDPHDIITIVQGLL